MKASFVMSFLCLVASVAHGQKKDTVLLRQVVITARPVQIRRMIDRTVVNVENSLAAQGANTLELLSKMPGVQVDADGGISLNGRSGVMIYLDGRASYLSANDLAQLLKGMSAEDISKIELMPHPSSKYDAAGSGGVINIVRRRNRRMGWNGSLRTGGGLGPYNKYYVGGDLGFHQGPLNFLLTSGYDHGYTYRKLAFSTYDLSHDRALIQQGYLRSLNRDRNSTNTLLADWNIAARSTLSLTGNVNWTGSVWHSDNYQDNWDSAGKPAMSSGLSAVTRNRAVSYDLGLRFVHQLDTTGRELAIDMDMASYPGRPRTVYSDGSSMDRDQGVMIYVGQIDHSLPIPGKSRLDVGAKTSYVRAVSDQQNSVNGMGAALSTHVVTTEQVNAAYVNWTGTIGKLHVEAGLRAEQTISSGKSAQGDSVLSSVDRKYMQVFPSLFVDYNVSEKDVVSLRFGSRVMRPSYALLNPQRQVLAANIIYEGNPALRPQRNTHIELGYSHNNAWWVNVGVMFYNSWYRTFFLTDTDGVTILKHPDATPFGWAPYIEAGWSGKCTRWWTANFSMHLFERRFSGKVGGLQPVYKYTPILSVDCGHELSFGRRWSADWRFKYVTYRQSISAAYGPYSSMSIAVRRTLFKGLGSVSLGVYNILDSEGNTVVEGLGKLEQRGYQYEYTRSLNANFNYRFGAARRTARRVRGDADERGRVN